MAKLPTLDPGSRDYVSCPRCTVQIPADLDVCPFCRQPVIAEEDPGIMDIRELLVPPERFPALRKFLREYGKALAIAASVLASVLALWIVFGLLTRVSVTIPKDPVFPIEVTREKSGRIDLLKGKLTNLGEDVPDFSLRSIGIIAELQYDDGKVERKRIFPKSPFRGEGALFRGESGNFEIEIQKGLKAVTFRAEVVNLGEDRQFVPIGQGSRRPSAPKKP